MNTNPGVIGRKLGMTQLFNDDGEVLPCTVLEVDCTVVGKRTAEKDGYDALILGQGERTEKHTNKPLAGFYEKQGVAPKREVRELRCSAEYAASVEVGQELKLDEVFSEGQYVDVQGVSKGRGYSGVMRRHNFRGGGASHGAHEYKRHGGSIGTNMTPGRVLKGKKMPGQHGNTTTTVLNQRIAKIVPEQKLLLIRGGMPGAKSATLIVRGAIKKKNAGKPAQ